jgi:hypothetical protein
MAPAKDCYNRKLQHNIGYLFLQPAFLGRKAHQVEDTGFQVT